VPPPSLAGNKVQRLPRPRTGQRPLPPFATVTTCLALSRHSASAVSGTAASKDPPITYPCSMGVSSGFEMRRNLPQNDTLSRPTPIIPWQLKCCSSALAFLPIGIAPSTVEAIFAAWDLAHAHA
jgi:hypothetical protein